MTFKFLVKPQKGKFGDRMRSSEYGLSTTLDNCVAKDQDFIKRLVCKNPRQFRAGSETCVPLLISRASNNSASYTEKKNSLVILLGKVYTLTRNTRHRFIIRELMTKNATILNAKFSERLFHSASSNLSSHC